METTIKRGGLKLTSIRRILKFLQVDPGPARKFVNWFIRHYSRLLEERRVRLTPAMVMLGEDICAHYILLSRRYQLLNRLETEGTQGTEDQKGDTSHNCREASQRGVPMLGSWLRPWPRCESSDPRARVQKCPYLFGVAA